MAFFDKINDLAKTATEKTNNAIEITKLTAKCDSEQRNLNAIIQKIGEYYVAKIDAGEVLDDEVMAMFEGVLTGRKNIAEMRAEIEALKAQEAELREIAKKELENETSRQLKDLGISINATKFVLGESAETTHSNIKDFANFIEELKEDLKRELLKGKTPRTSSSVASNVITKEQFKRMSYMEKMDLYNKDIELFNKLNQ